MPFTTPSNQFIWGLAKQTNEATPNTTEQYGLPVFSGRSMPVQTSARIEVTDSTSTWVTHTSKATSTGKLT